MINAHTRTPAAVSSNVIIAPEFNKEKLYKEWKDPR